MARGTLTCKGSGEDWRCEGMRDISCRSPRNSSTLLTGPYPLEFFLVSLLWYIECVSMKQAQVNFATKKFEMGWEREKEKEGYFKRSTPLLFQPAMIAIRALRLLSSRSALPIAMTFLNTFTRFFSSSGSMRTPVTHDEIPLNLAII